MKFRAQRRRFAAGQLKRGHWTLIFDTGARFVTFEASGTELPVLLEVFAWLGGAHPRTEVLARFRGSAALVRRFLRFLEKERLLVQTHRPDSQPATKPGIEHVSHSCLWANDCKAEVVFDPVFFQPRGLGAEKAGRYSALARAAARFESLSAAFFTHNHWDHFNVSTVARLPRHLPIYVPRVRRETPYNPSLKRFLCALGFTRVHEVDWWQRVRVGSLSVLIVPYYGEWFGPGSEFDGFTYLFEARNKAVYGSVDAFRDDRGDMGPVLRKLKKAAPRIDCFFYADNGGSHESPLICGMPYVYTNTNGRLERKLQYLPDKKAAARFRKILRARRAVPYADFEFHSKPRAVVAF